MATHLPAMYAVSALFTLKLEAKIASSSQSHESSPLPGRDTALDVYIPILTHQRREPARSLPGSTLTLHVGRVYPFRHGDVLLAQNLQRVLWLTKQGVCQRSSNTTADTSCRAPKSLDENPRALSIAPDLGLASTE